MVQGLHGFALCWLVLAGCAAPQTGLNAQALKPAATAPTRAALPAHGMAPQDIDAISAHHDQVRAEVGVAPLKWSTEIAAHAQQWADQLASRGCQMKHRSPNAYGENLFQGTVGAYKAVDAAKAWAAEKKDYHGGPLTESSWAPAGHYTQMVWRQTTLLGCGQAICQNLLIVACNYGPPGNVIGRKPY